MSSRPVLRHQAACFAPGDVAPETSASYGHSLRASGCAGKRDAEGGGTEPRRRRRKAISGIHTKASSREIRKFRV